MHFLKPWNFILLLTLLPGQSESLLEWLFGKSNQEATLPENSLDRLSNVHPASLQLKNTKFEMQTVDEKFAAAGQDLIAKMSELDKCHLLVVSELKAACADISEEELAKLGVALLNCQSQAEGRTVYPCSPDMTVAECTKPMDPDTWNAYLIVSNRARSVCYSVRQQQFQRQTQFAVSQLASSAEDQLYLMEHLRQHQQELVSVAEKTLEGMTEGQEDMMKAQETMKITQIELQNGLAGNVESLMNEKALIAAGHKELAEMAANITKKLDHATHQLSAQDVDRQQYRKDLMKDLAGIQERTKALIEQLDSNFNQVLSFQRGSSSYYQETLQKLLVVNQTVSYLLGTVGEMKTGIDEKLTWVSSLLGGAGNNLDLLVTCVLHACYFFLAAFILTFLSTPVTSRVLVIMLVPLNALAEINHGHSLNFPSLTVVLFTIVSVNVGIQYSKTRHSSRVIPPSPNGCLTCRGSSPLKLSPIHPIKTDETIASINSGKRPGDLTTPNFEEEDSSNVQESTWWTRDETTLTGELASLLREKENETSKLHGPTTKVQNLSRLSVVGGTPEKVDLQEIDAAKRHLGPLLGNTTTSSRAQSANDSSKVTPGSPQRSLCIGFTKTGQGCKLTSTKGSSYCHRHANDK